MARSIIDPFPKSSLGEVLSTLNEVPFQLASPFVSAQLSKTSCMAVTQIAVDNLLWKIKASGMLPVGIKASDWHAPHALKNLQALCPDSSTVLVTCQRTSCTSCGSSLQEEPAKESWAQRMIGMRFAPTEQDTRFLVYTWAAGAQLATFISKRCPKCNLHFLGGWRYFLDRGHVKECRYMGVKEETTFFVIPHLHALYAVELSLLKFIGDSMLYGEATFQSTYAIWCGQHREKMQDKLLRGVNGTVCVNRRRRILDAWMIFQAVTLADGLDDQIEWQFAPAGLDNTFVRYGPLLRKRHLESVATHFKDCPRCQKVAAVITDGKQGARRRVCASTDGVQHWPQTRIAIHSGCLQQAPSNGKLYCHSCERRLATSCIRGEQVSVLDAALCYIEGKPKIMYRVLVKHGLSDTTATRLLPKHEVDKDLLFDFEIGGLRTIKTHSKKMEKVAKFPQGDAGDSGTLPVGQQQTVNADIVNVRSASSHVIPTTMAAGRAVCTRKRARKEYITVTARSQKSSTSQKSRDEGVAEMSQSFPGPSEECAGFIRVDAANNMVENRQSAAPTRATADVKRRAPKCATRFYISKSKHVQRFGPTPGCLGCTSATNHTEVCRLRMMQAIQEAGLDNEKLRRQEEKENAWIEAEFISPRVPSATLSEQGESGSSAAAPATEQLPWGSSPAAPAPARILFRKGKNKNLQPVSSGVVCRDDGLPETTGAEPWKPLQDQWAKKLPGCSIDKQKDMCKRRRLTGGMQTAVLQCGLVADWTELMRGESLQLVYAMVARLLQDLSGMGIKIDVIFYDNACKLWAMANRLATDAVPATKLMAGTRMMLDELHRANHSWCLTHRPCVDPLRPENREISSCCNTQACEQLNSWITNRTKGPLEMSRGRFLVFWWSVFRSRNDQKLLQAGEARRRFQRGYARHNPDNQR